MANGTSGETLARTTGVDLVPTNFLMLFTPEYAELKRLRAQNGYDTSKPTFARPNAMPFSFETVDGVKIRTARTERSSKPLLVMLNPLPQSIMAFAPMWPELAEHFDLFAYDLPGFGRSDGGSDFMTFVAQGDFLAKVIQQFDLEDAHILGPDIGMPTAIHYVGTQKNSVKSIIVGDGPAIAPSVNGSAIEKMVNSKFWQFAMRTVSSGAFVEVGNRIGYVNYVPNADELSDYILSYKGRIGPVIEWFKGYPESLATVDPLLKDIQTPTLVFWGKNDALLSVDMADRLRQRMPNCEVNIIENCGHYSYQDQHAVFAKMIVDWVQRH